MMKGDLHDPKGLILEAFRIEGITASECRSIFLDWALSIPLERDNGVLINALLLKYEPQYPEHPMTIVLREGQNSITAPRRRGGWRSRRT